MNSLMIDINKRFRDAGIDTTEKQHKTIHTAIGEIISAGYSMGIEIAEQNALSMILDLMRPKIDLRKVVHVIR
jgi:hypothetical protein